MPAAERRERYESLIVRVRTNNVERWREAFLDALKEASPEDAS
jgi:trehalose-6-phosphate synthase